MQSVLLENLLWVPRQKLKRKAIARRRFVEYVLNFVGEGDAKQTVHGVEQCSTASRQSGLVNIPKSAGVLMPLCLNC